MTLLVGLVGAVLIVAVLWDAFEVVILPRRVVRRFRLARGFYRLSWAGWSAVARRMPTGRRREAYLSVYGPLSLLVLLMLWAATLIAGFGLVQWALRPTPALDRGPASLSDALYLSGSTFFTLGLGDIVPVGAAAKTLAVVESGTGFLFLAVIVGYLPVLYQAFSRREVAISMLDARAGSPPSASELLRRHRGDLHDLSRLLSDWERWSAEFLESHVSFPVLSYFRSQHDNESWLAAITTILDTCTLMTVGVDDPCRRQAQLTFAIARHAVSDLAQVLAAPPQTWPDRLPSKALAELRETLAAHGIPLDESAAAERKIAELRRLYEPYVHGLAARLLLTLPRWTEPERGPDNWRTTAWDPHPPPGGTLPFLDS